MNIFERYNNDDWDNYEYKHSTYRKSKIEQDVTVEDFIKFFKDNPDKLDEVIVQLRKDKIEKIKENAKNR